VKVLKTKPLIPDITPTQQEIIDRQNARITELEAEVERLKCCGNCSWCSLEDFALMCGHKSDDSVPGDWWGDVHSDDPCHFTPPKWTPVYDQ